LDTTNSTVQVVRDQTAQTVHVTMIAQDAKNAVVTGLPPGAVVIANGQLGLADGQRVQPQSQVAEK
jgi:hypothetical protein